MNEVQATYQTENVLETSMALQQELMWLLWSVQKSLGMLSAGQVDEAKELLQAAEQSAAKVLK